MCSDCTEFINKYEHFVELLHWITFCLLLKVKIKYIYTFIIANWKHLQKRYWAHRGRWQANHPHCISTLTVKLHWAEKTKKMWEWSWTQCEFNNELGISCRTQGDIGHTWNRESRQMPVQQRKSQEHQQIGLCNTAVVSVRTLASLAQPQSARWNKHQFQMFLLYWTPENEIWLKKHHQMMEK